MAQNAKEVSLAALHTGKLRRRLLLLLWVAILGGGAFAWYSFKPKLEAEVEIVSRGTAVSAVYGTVLIEPKVQTIVRAQSSGVVADVKVKKGDLIKEGELLLEIRDDTAIEALRAAEIALSNAVRAREIGPAAAPAFEAAQQELARIKRLVDQGNLAASEFDRKNAELKTLNDRVQTETLVLDSAIEQAKQRLEAARTVETRRYVRSPQNGIVMEFFTQLGQVVSSQEQIFIIGSQETQLRALVNEEDVGSLKVGMESVVRLYSYPGVDFKATLRDILPMAANREYSVILDLVDPPERLLPGMTGELNIIIGRRENTIIIPSRAIRVAVRQSVFVVDDEGIVRARDVKIGFRSIEKTEIIEGLQEGEMIILSDHDLFTAGQKVQPRVRK